MTQLSFIDPIHSTPDRRFVPDNQRRHDSAPHRLPGSKLERELLEVRRSPGVRDHHKTSYRRGA
jgi:hypothetical protein